MFEELKLLSTKLDLTIPKNILQLLVFTTFDDLTFLNTKKLKKKNIGKNNAQIWVLPLNLIYVKPISGIVLFDVEKASVSLRLKMLKTNWW